MFPLKDHTPRWSFPGVTLVLILANVAIFLYQFSLASTSPQAMHSFVMTFGAIPARVGAAMSGDYSLVMGVGPLLTSIFLHGGWMHLIGNMWFLWVFGDNIEDELGHGVYLIFYIISGLMASVVHILMSPSSNIPIVGARGAIAGVMGAYMIRFPMSRVVTLIPLFIIFTTIELPAFVLLLYWFGIQFFSGAMTLNEASSGGVAWWAHVGGFLTGIVLIWLRPRRRRYRRIYHHT